MGVAAAGGLGRELGGQGGQDAGLVFGLGGDQAGGAFRLQVQHGPQGGEDVHAVQAQVVGGPAGGQGGGQVPVAGPVYLVHPAAQPGDRLLPGVGGQGPPGRGRAGLVAAGLWSGRVRGEAVGQAGEQGGQRGVMAGLAGVEPGELLAVSGELVQRSR